MDDIDLQLQQLEEEAHKQQSEVAQVKQILSTANPKESLLIDIDGEHQPQDNVSIASTSSERVEAQTTAKTIASISSPIPSAPSVPPKDKTLVPIPCIMCEQASYWKFLN